MCDGNGFIGYNGCFSPYCAQRFVSSLSYCSQPCAPHLGRWKHSVVIQTQNFFHVPSEGLWREKNKAVALSGGFVVDLRSWVIKEFFDSGRILHVLLCKRACVSEQFLSAVSLVYGKVDLRMCQGHGGVHKHFFVCGGAHAIIKSTWNLKQHKFPRKAARRISTGGFCSSRSRSFCSAYSFPVCTGFLLQVRARPSGRAGFCSVSPRGFP